MAENIKEVFWLTSLDGSQLLYVNSAYEEIWGRPTQSLYEHPQSWLEAIHPNDRDRMMNFYENLSRGDFDEKECRIIRPDGNIRCIYVHPFPIRNEHGEVYRVAGIGVDITERKLTAIKTLQDLMVTLAHYIRNANTVIGGFAARLLKHTSEAEIQRVLKLVQKASQEIDAVINTLQNLTEITTTEYIKSGIITMIDMKKELETRLRSQLVQDHHNDNCSHES